MKNEISAEAIYRNRLGSTDTVVQTSRLLRAMAGVYTYPRNEETWYLSALPYSFLTASSPLVAKQSLYLPTTFFPFFPIHPLYGRVMTCYITFLPSRLQFFSSYFLLLLLFLKNTWSRILQQFCVGAHELYM
jgi:hypothetical protein